jgi:hypothetical protein
VVHEARSEDMLWIRRNADIRNGREKHAAGQGFAISRDLCAMHAPKRKVHKYKDRERQCVRRG